MRLTKLLITTNILLLIILLMAVIGGSQPQGAQAAETTTITACKAKSGGALRVASACKSTETLLVWNIRGAQGAQGVPGTNATVQTQILKFKFLSARGGSLGCSPGTQLSSATGNAGYMYPWFVSSSTEKFGELSSARNWKPIYECEITLKVVQ